MSYEQPFNGEYDHQDLFGIGEKVWYAWWDANTARYEARLVEITKIIIDSERVWYKAVYSGRIKDEYVDELEDQVLYEDEDYAKNYARERLAIELDNRLFDAEMAVDSTKKHYDDAVFEYKRLEQLSDKLKKEKK